MLLEEYLRSHGLTDFEFDPAIAGTSRRPDYLLRADGTEVLLECKEFIAKAEDFQIGGGAYDPYAHHDLPLEADQRLFVIVEDQTATTSLHVFELFPSGTDFFPKAGEVLKAALQTGDLAAAEHNLAAEWGQESLYGGKVRFFTPEALEAMLKDASLTLTARRGVRVIADYLPAQISRSADYERIFALERKLGNRPEFFAVARYMHCLARCVAPRSEVDE